VDHRIDPRSVGIFAYVGAEVAIGVSSLTISLSRESPGSPKRTPLVCLFLLGGAMIGRFIGSALLRKVKTGHLLGVCAICATSLATTSMLTGGRPACGASSPWVFQLRYVPQHFHLGSGRTRSLAGDGSGILNMAIVGERRSASTRLHCRPDRNSPPFFLPVVCYLYILYYALAAPNQQPAQGGSAGHWDSDQFLIMRFLRGPRIRKREHRKNRPAANVLEGSYHSSFTDSLGSVARGLVFR